MFFLVGKMFNSHISLQNLTQGVCFFAIKTFQNGDSFEKLYTFCKFCLVYQCWSICTFLLLIYTKHALVKITDWFPFIYNLSKTLHFRNYSMMNIGISKRTDCFGKLFVTGGKNSSSSSSDRIKLIYPDAFLWNQCYES